MTAFALLCAGMLIHGNAKAIDVSGRNVNVVEQHMKLAAVRARVYADGQYQITIARDRRRVWVQLDRDDNPHDRGAVIRCVKKFSGSAGRGFREPRVSNPADPRGR